ncbi:Coiled-coil domain-containing protein 82 [Apophysomyces sp. BC1034]|nr:Coiled-coil domain-containing protein 82 [Apophysomyces sp. BC1021]KAG0184632.1 Coiled-coil domain-containing protein 82 [Apophysomyces sp. BC1034]
MPPKQTKIDAFFKKDAKPAPKSNAGGESSDKSTIETPNVSQVNKENDDKSLPQMTNALECGNAELTKADNVTLMTEENEDENEDPISITAKRSRKRRQLLMLDDEDEEKDQEDDEPLFLQTEMASSSNHHARKSRRIILESETEETNTQEDLDFLNENDRKQKLASITGSEGPIDQYRIQEIQHHGSCEVDEEGESDGVSENDEGFVVDDDVIDGVKVADVYESNRVELPAPYFQVALRAVDRRVSGFLESSLTSDAWLPHFKGALDKYPYWSRVSGDSMVTCEGCRSNRPASRQVFLSYEKDDSEGRAFALGSECYRRAKMYHLLAHFRSHLYDTVEEEVERVTENMKKVEGGDDLRLMEDYINELELSGFIKSRYQESQRLFQTIEDLYVTNRGRRPSNVMNGLFESESEEESVF